MVFHNHLNWKGFFKRRFAYLEVLVFLCVVVVVILQAFRYTPFVSAAPSDLKIYAEAASFARLDSIDPSGWFYQAVLYNPTDTDIVVTGLRWWYNASASIVDNNRNARCYDTRYFSGLPSLSVPNSRTTRWEYASGSISIIVPAKKMILTWIEVPTGSVNDDSILTTYYVQAYAGNQWISSPLYVSHSGHDDSMSTVFRADFDLTTNPNNERHAVPGHQNPEWLFNEERFVVANLSSRVRLIPITSGRNEDRISWATVNVTLPAGWSYVGGSASNPYGETISYFSVGGKDRLSWSLNRDVIRYANNQSMAQNYIEFNVTAPLSPGVYNFTVAASVTSSQPRTTLENQQIYVVVRMPPTATFTFSPTTPFVNQSVSFNASSSYDLDGTILNYTWDFGDEQTGNGSVVNHVYTSLGIYTAMLTVTDNDGLRGTKSSDVPVIKSPVASFTFSPSSPLIGEIVTFNASSSTPNGGSLISYSWNFGDGDTDSGIITTHAYANVGNYTVVLNVTDSEGLWDTETKILIVRKTPIAFFTYSPTLPLISQTISFNASLSTPNGGALIDYLWDFGDGVTDNGVIVTHSYINFGNYTVTLTVTDSEGLADNETKTIKVFVRPSASFTYWPQPPAAFSPVIFNASSSQDSDGSLVTYAWDFGDDNVTFVSSPIIAHVYNASGSFMATLTVFDNDGLNGSSSMPLTVVVHDVAILSVSPSPIEVQAGQSVNVTVVVKNKGTTIETFNITVYYNNTQLGTQSVTDLASDATATLIFSWNTSGLTEGAIYTIWAETSEIMGEADTIDNNLLGGIVKISLSPSTPSSFWDTTLPYILPIGAAIASILLLAAVTVMRRPNKLPGSSISAVPTEFQPFTDLTGGELPDAYSVMIVGDASAGKSVLCQQLANMYLNQGKSCIYITYDCFPDEIRKNMKDFGWDISLHEQSGIFAFVDSYSPIAGKSSKEKFFVKQPFALSELGIAISVAIGKLGQKSPRIFLDSTVPLFTRLEPARVVEFLQDRSATIKGENGAFFFTIGRGTIPQDLQRRLEEIVDCIIDLEVGEHGGDTTRKLRIKKLRGRSFSDQWVAFKIDMKRGFVLFVPKHSSKSKK